MLFNLHTHTHFSDGSAAPQAYLDEAIRQGFHTLGFSDHSPVPFENTFALREERLQEYIEVCTPPLTGVKSTPAPAGDNSTPPPAPPLKLGEGCGETELTVLLGLEIDYIPGITKPIEAYRKMGCFDYFIGSVHLVKNGTSDDLWFIDGPDIELYDKGLQRVFQGDIRKGVTAYYHQVCEMLETQRPEIIGHMDKIRMYNRNRYFREDESWYQTLVNETLSVIKSTQTIVEVNTRGLYKKRSDALFPGVEILKKIEALKIPIIISSDAHKPEELSYGFEDARKTLIELGFKSTVLLDQSEWKEVKLS